MITRRISLMEILLHNLVLLVLISQQRISGVDFEEQISNDNIDTVKQNEYSSLDKNEKCKLWAEKGHCYKNSEYMSKACMGSCGLGNVNELLEDTKEYGVMQDAKGPEKFFTLDAIRASLSYMRSFGDTLPKAKIKKCRNKNKLCAFWAGLGHCESNSGYMANNCAPSCQNCTKIFEAHDEIFDDIAEKAVIVDREVNEDTVLKEIEKYGVTQIATGNEKQLTLNVMQLSLDYMDSLEDDVHIDASLCRNTHSYCSFWAAIGKCKDSSFMKVNCAPSCHTCHLNESTDDTKLVKKADSFGVTQEAFGGEKEITLKVIERSISYMKSLESKFPEVLLSQCRNEHKSCSFWSSLGRCETHREYMSSQCAPSCQTCDQIFEEKKNYLNKEIQKHGVSQKIVGKEQDSTIKIMYSTIEYMESLHGISSETMIMCQNKDEMCSHWASEGYCETNRTKMVMDCSPACGSCHLLEDVLSLDLDLKISSKLNEEFTEDGEELPYEVTNFEVTQIIREQTEFETLNDERGNSFDEYDDEAQEIDANDEISYVPTEALTVAIPHAEEDHACTSMSIDECKRNASYLEDDCAPSCHPCYLKNSHIETEKFESQLIEIDNALRLSIVS